MCSWRERAKDRHIKKTLFIFKCGNHNDNSSNKLSFGDLNILIHLVLRIALGGRYCYFPISQARKLKKSLAAQKKLIADYEKNFTKEGKPVSAQVDVSKIKGIDAEPMVIDPAKVSELLSKADDASTDAFLSE